MGMCLLGTGAGHCEGWLSRVMVVSEVERWGATGRERAMVAIAVVGSWILIEDGGRRTSSRGHGVAVVVVCGIGTEERDELGGVRRIGRHKGGGERRSLEMAVPRVSRDTAECRDGVVIADAR